MINIGCALCATFLFIPHFDVICDLLLNRRTATWNLFVNHTTLLASMCHAMPFFFQTPVLWPFQMASSMAAPLQMPMRMICRKMIIILLEYLLYLNSWK